MNELNETDCFPLRVVRIRSNGKRDYDPIAKLRLIELCRRPGVSIARLALKAQVNANQLRKWIRADKQSATEPCVVEREMPAFVPLLTPISATSVVTVESSAPQSQLIASVHVRLPNGVQLDIGKSDLAQLTAVIEMLGRLPCSGSTKR
ncbi:IS66-like element accessory protein TnpA [Pandoraea sp. NPDC090278]|uniref:IS66-like element accessory protein TnpA n=1 Tax=Pandoraea sp. NPDC090278 TaxID=3364391 RepID=UPI003839FEB2